MFILVAHGSRNPRWRKSLEDLSASLGGEGTDGEVGLAFMQFDGPNLPEVVEKSVARGVTEFELLPLFMASAGHVDQDIRPLVEELREQFPETRLELLAPIGEDPLFLDLIQTIVNNRQTKSRS